MAGAAICWLLLQQLVCGAQTQEAKMGVSSNIRFVDSQLRSKLGARALEPVCANCQLTNEQLESIGRVLGPLASSPALQMSPERRALLRRLSEGLAEPARSCTGEWSAFWAHLLEGAEPDQRRDSPVVTLARSLLLGCWRLLLDSMPGLLSRALDKAPEQSFAGVEMLAKQLDELAAGERLPRGSAAVTIQERRAEQVEEEEEDDEEDLFWKIRAKSTWPLETRLARLRRVQLASGQELRSLAMALNRVASLAEPQLASRAEESRALRLLKLRHFYTNFLELPCGQLVERARQVLALAEPLKSQAARLGPSLELKPTLGAELVRAASGDPQLNLKLQIYRICRLSGQKSAV